MMLDPETPAADDAYSELVQRERDALVQRSLAASATARQLVAEAETLQQAVQLARTFRARRLSARLRISDRPEFET